MTGSIQGSAIDDSFETLTNAPDAWVSGRYAAAPPVDYQHYVEPGDTRSAVDDRCFTEHGAVEHTRYVKTTKPAKADSKHRQSRQTSSKPPSHGKRRPSPSFRIRSKDGDSVVVSNPFVLRKPSRPQPRREAGSSSQTDDQSQSSATTTARSRTFQIRIRGKNGKEAIHEIKRPLYFASQSGNVRESQATTLVGDDSGRENVEYWAANQSESSQKREQRHKSKSGQPIFTDFVVDSSTVASSTPGSSVRMSGALPRSSPAPTTNSSRSRLLPPEKPDSSMHDSVMSVSKHPSKSPSHAVSHQFESSPKSSSRILSQNEVIIVPDESLDGSAVTPFSSLSTHCIVSPRAVSSNTPIEQPEANDASSTSDLAPSSISSNATVDKSSSSASSVPPSTTSRMSSSRIVTLTQSSKQEQEYQDDSRPVTVSLSKQKELKQEAYYNWKAPKDSLYSISTKSSKPVSSRPDLVAPEKITSATSKASSHHGGLTSRHADADSDASLSERSRVSQTLPKGYKPPPRSSSARSASAIETIDGRVQGTISEKTQTSGQSRSARCIPLPESRSSSSRSKASRSSKMTTRQSTHLASQKPVHGDQEWNKPLSEAAATEWTVDEHSELPASHHTDPDEWGQAAEWEEPSTSSHRSKMTRTSRSHRNSSRQYEFSGRHANESLQQEHNGHELWANEEEGSQRSTRSTSPVNIEEDLLHYLPAPSDDDRLPPPMPMLTTIYEESEPTPSSHVPSMLTQETTRFARPGAISPHPLSSVSSAATARKPPTNEPYRLEYQKPYVESKSSSSASSGAHDSDFSRRSSRPRMLEEQAYHSAKEASRSRSQVLALCYSAGTGQYLLTGSTDRQIRLFNPATGLEVQKYSAHGYEVHDLRVAQDNDRFISVGGDKTVFLWDVATHQTLRRWSGHAGRINACAFAGEGDSLVVTGSFDSTIKIWDCKQRNEKPIMTLSEAKDAVSSVSVSGAEILAGSVDSRVRCYDVRMGVIDQDVLGHPITSVTPTVNNDSYLASTLDSTLRLMDKRDGKLLQAFRHPDFKNENYRLRSTLAAGDSLAISGSEDGHIYIWDLLTGNLSHKLKHSAPVLTDGTKAFVSMSSKRDVVNSVVWNQLRKEWASAGGDGSVVVWGT
ncbi:unnamed protein product [Aureobasidium mustum]|uniref:WD40 repeat-like protein n=1 Tax=Aureobasidium mustum TaxID=2773714 RepID=A0A9N8PNB6_9PEZI|nr:unnamed protein product [Aureobasidium mustum]